MIAMSVGAIAEATSGRVVGDATVTVDGPVQTDAREPIDRGLFVAKRGEITDGHRFVGQAVDGGCAAVIVEHELSNVPVPQIVVDDAVTALSLLARAVVATCRRDGKLRHVVGITGSAGKTTTKHILGHLLTPHFNTVIPIRSFNNEVGAPSTMLRIDLDTEVLVVEMGATHMGNIAWLCSLAKPDIGVVLQVGMAHVGEFGSQEQIAATKGEMVESLPADGTAVLNLDDRLVAPMRDRTVAEVKSFGADPAATVQILDPQQHAGSITFDLRIDNAGTFPVRMRLIGIHNAWNAAAATVAALACGLDAATICAGLESLPHGERWRMQVLERSDGVTIINDAYNASPDAMHAALRTLATLGSTAGRRTVAILGAMGELGDFAATAHSALGEQVVRLNIDLLVVVGIEARAIYQTAVMEGSWGNEAVYFDTASEARSWLSDHLRKGDVALVKSSNAAGLRVLGDDLADDQPVGEQLVGDAPSHRAEAGEAGANK